MAMWNSAKTFWTLVFCLYSLSAQATVPFEVAGRVTEKGQADTILELKHKAVTDWLRQKLGSRYDGLAEQVTPEFADGYVLDYLVGKIDGQPGYIKVSGHIDGPALMRWARLSETKSRGGGFIKPMLVYSSNLDYAKADPRQTGQTVRSDNLGRTLLTLSQATLNTFSVSIQPPKDFRLPVTEPPRRDYDIDRMRDYAVLNAFNSVLWLDVQECARCGGAKLSTFFYNLPQGRVSTVRQHNLKINASILADSEKLKANLAPAFTQLQKDFEELVSSGNLSSRLHQLVIEGLDSYKGFRALSRDLGDQDFITQAALKEIRPQKVRFELFSPLQTPQLQQRLRMASFRGFRLQPVRVSSNVIVVRYLRQVQ